eukprot:CAMPEP_0194085500 /NCGR_PEP_ID=MMETSP0149-20130528/17647_1 /TAXON_ID=122233 /ORGANISM="Chaetoceros debilis, Strain MM31A-1" /LENGTH=332 /DNA_ID=CAMNT_0038768393 /DNA_START=95 /DNA_END=1093 /DNA_ORIENTATION=-
MKSGIFTTSLCLLLSRHETFAFTVTTSPTLSQSKTASASASASESASASALFAKKKKGKKNKSKKKEAGFAWAASFTLKPFESASLRDLASSACASFEGRTGKPLTEEIRKSSDVPKTLWNAPVACVIVGDESGDGGEDGDAAEATTAGPVIQYANIAALESVGLKPDQFEQLLATKDPESGEWKVSGKVDKFIDLPSVMKGDKAYESGYKKKMVKANADDAASVDITIESAQRWKLEKSALINGKFVTETLGVAYAWNSWVEGEDTLCRPGKVREVNIDTGDIEDKIKAQGEVIRELKEVQGFGNKDPEVSDAVQELLRLKALLEEVVASK